MRAAVAEEEEEEEEDEGKRSLPSGTDFDVMIVWKLPLRLLFVLLNCVAFDHVGEAGAGLDVVVVVVDETCSTPGVAVIDFEGEYDEEVEKDDDEEEERGVVEADEEGDLIPRPTTTFRFPLGERINPPRWFESWTKARLRNALSRALVFLFCFSDVFFASLPPPPPPPLLSAM